MLAGPCALAAAGVVARFDAGRPRWRAAAALGALVAGLDLGFELWVGGAVRVATTPWEIVRLGAIVPAVTLMSRLPAERARWLSRAALALAALAAALACLGLAVCLQGAAQGRGTKRAARADAAVVLGFALRPDGRPAPSLVARVRHAARLVREGTVPRIVLTGGRTGAPVAESAVADAIARRAGVPSEAILREERSRTTAENLREAARVVARLGCRSVLVVTEPHHLGRAMLLARAAGLPARPSVSGSPLWRLRPAPYWLVREVAYLPAALPEVWQGPASPRAPSTASLELVESAPIETTLDHADLRNAHDVWPALFSRARRTIDLAEFYASNEPDSRLEAAVRALLAAADRGVRVRFLADASFTRLYPDTLARLDAHPAITVRRLDFARDGAGGILHEKAFVLDGEEAWLGSQNFDWRSLTHIQELGAHVQDAAVARAMGDLFEADWARAGGAEPRRTHRAAYDFPRGIALVASPRDTLPDESLWDLPHLLAWIDGARRSVRVQLLTYGDDEGRWPVLSDALRRAALRGVHVQLLVSHWATRPRTRAALARLEAGRPALAVKIATIPPASGGFVPFARVVHAKYMVVDDERAWIGTSNWEREYFLESRNVGLLVERRTVARRLAAFFDGLWRSGYAEAFDPARQYAPPRIAE